MNLELSQKSKEILKIQNKEEFNLALTLWTLDEKEIWDNFIPQSLPIMPQLVKEYFQMPIEQRKRINESFWQEPEVKLYFDQRDSITNLNRRNSLWLQECMKHLPNHEIEKRQKLTERIFDFKERGY